MPLLDLSPHWVADGEGRHGMGLSFLCPSHRKHRLVVMFANPLDGGAPAAGRNYLWQRAGETFDALTLTPSVDASGGAYPYTNGEHVEIETACWHGSIREGRIE